MSAQRLKVMTIVGTRPELIKLSRVIAELDKQTDHVLVHSGQNYAYSLNQVFFEQMAIRTPDHFLEVAHESVHSAIGLIIERAGQLLREQRPDAVLFYGDTNTCLAVIAAKREQIPVFHMEAGNRCFDQRVPEENNRKIIDHLSDINMPLTEHGRRYLLQEGLPAEQVIKIGSCMQEVLAHYWPSIERSTVLQRLNLQPGQYFVVSAHREENVDNPENLNYFIESLSALAEKYKKPIIVSTHPRTQQRLKALELEHLQESIHFAEAFGFFDYVRLQTQAMCVLSDSGTITEEAALLNFPAVTIRQAHERPEGMDQGILIMSGLTPQRVLQAVETVTAQYKTSEQRLTAPVADYETPGVSYKVVRIIMSYVDYINRVVWHVKS